MQEEEEKGRIISNLRQLELYECPVNIICVKLTGCKGKMDLGPSEVCGPPDMRVCSEKLGYYDVGILQ